MQDFINNKHKMISINEQNVDNMTFPSKEISSPMYRPYTSVMVQQSSCHDNPNLSQELKKEPREERASTCLESAAAKSLLSESCNQTAITMSQFMRSKQ